jgi:large subunit ribosomal protein L24
MVEVIAGDYRGVRGRVLRVDPQTGRVTVEGVNRVYKHVRPSRRTPQGGRLQVERPIDASNVMRIHPKTDRPTRVRYGVNGKGQKVRMTTDGVELETLGPKQS